MACGGHRQGPEAREARLEVLQPAPSGRAFPIRRVALIAPFCIQNAIDLCMLVLLLHLPLGSDSESAHCLLSGTRIARRLGSPPAGSGRLPRICISRRQVGICAVRMVGWQDAWWDVSWGVRMEAGRGSVA